jgi:hypothetical protein
MQTAILVIIGLVVLVYVGAPLLIKSTMRLNRRPTVRAMDVPALPSEAHDYFGRTAGPLAALGFELRAYFALDDAVPNVNSVHAWWVNHDTGQNALASVIYTRTPNSALPPKAKPYLEFLTKEASGLAIMTNNSPDASSFKRLPDADTLIASAVQDVNDLYRLHVAREHRLGSAGATRYVPAPGDELAVFVEMYDYPILRQVEVGYFRYDDQADVYRMTTRGAFAMTWGQLPPIVQLRRARDRAEASRQLAEVNRAPRDPRRGVPVTSDSPYKAAVARMRSGLLAAR